MKKKRTRSRRKPEPAGPTAVDLARWREEFRSWEESGRGDRPDKVIEVKLRLSQGYYDRPEVLQKIVRALLPDLLPAAPPDAKRSRAPKRTKRADAPAPNGARPTK